MRIFVVAREPVRPEERDDPCWAHVAKTHDVKVGTRDLPYGWKPQAIVGMGVTIMDETFAAAKRWSKAKLFCYNWDVYEWVWSRPRKEETPGTPGFLDYRRYGELLQRADEVWVPSDCTARRTRQWWPGVKSVERILSACPWWDHPNVRDDGYALCCMREIPDPWWGVFERCCDELKIPFRSTRHECSEAAYRDAVAGCRFICCPLWECSTGGLSLMEAYRLGKPCLINDSEWNGGRDYLGARADYFPCGNGTAFKSKLWVMYHAPVSVESDHREWIEENFSNERMADNIMMRIKAHG